MKRKIILMSAVLLMVLAAAAMFKPGDPEKPVSILVRPGVSASDVAENLSSSEVVKNAVVLEALIRLTGKSDEIKYGAYSLREGMGYLNVVRKLSAGSEKYIKVSIPEGFTSEQIAARLKAAGVIENIEKFISAVEERNLRGFLFPETYYFSRHYGYENVLQAMKGQFERVFSKKFENRSRELGMTVKEVVTMASLIEKEAKVPEERPIISDIFHKRLSKRMYLESCASVQFALGEHKERLTYEDLAIDSPYNTYRNFGLPPTPICNPGLKAIKAALYPADTEYLFFFAGGEDGSHEFSSTYERHLSKQRMKK